MRVTWDRAKEIIADRTEEYLAGMGVRLDRRGGREWSKDFRCLNPQHPDRNPSMAYNYLSRRCHCKSCNATYDIFGLIGIDYGISDFSEQVKKGAELYQLEIENTPRKAAPEEEFRTKTGQKQSKSGQYTDTHTDVYTHKAATPKKDFTAYYERCRQHLGETDYHRGLSSEVLERHHIGYDSAFKTKDAVTDAFVTWGALVIPTSRESYVLRNTDPNAHHRNRYRNRGAAHIFNYKALQSATTPIFCVEGEIDAMSIEEVGGAAVGLGSYDNITLLLKLLDTVKPVQPLIIALDRETEESKKADVSKAEKALEDGLQSRGITFYRLDPFVGYHDANEALMRDREAFTEAVARAENIEQQAEEEERAAYLATNTAAYLQQFIDGIAESANTECIPTGFETLDRVLDGGLYEGLIVAGGLTSIGKTSLIQQVADAVAQGGRDVLLFSLEMARTELMSKSISRHTLDLCIEYGYDTRNAKTARGITDGKRHIYYNQTERDLIMKAIEAYGAYADRIYIQEGVGDIGVNEIRETVERHIRFTGRRPLVIVDYLQIIAPYSERATDKQNTDKAVLELKRISRDFKIPVIAISSFNRTNYKEAVTMEAFKESGAVEYGCDVLIGLQLKGAEKKDFNPTEEKKKDPRQVELIILKNRQGRVGDKILFSYYPMFNYFEDKGISK